MVLTCYQQPPAHSYTLPPKSAHSFQCFTTIPVLSALCFKIILAHWAPWCLCFLDVPWWLVPWVLWTQHVQSKPLLPEPVVTILANGPTLTQMPKPETWKLLFSPSLPRSNWLARRIELPFPGNIISLVNLGFPSHGHWKSSWATGGLFRLGWVVSLKLPRINVCATLY